VIVFAPDLRPSAARELGRRFARLLR